MDEDPTRIPNDDREAEPEGDLSVDDVTGAEIDFTEAIEGEGDEELALDSARALAPYDPLQRYLMEIRRYPLLSREDEHQLGVRYREQGDLHAAFRLVTANLRLVVMVARQYQRASRDLLDLIQEGNIGLMEAVKKFDPYRGIRFPSYAVWWVRAYMIRYLMNTSRMVKLGTTQAQRKLFFNLRKEKEKLEAEGIWPGPKLLAQRLDVKESEIVEMDQRLSSRDVSVDGTTGDDEGRTLLELLSSGELPAEQEFAEAEFRERVSRKMHEFGATLKDKEAIIFESRLLADRPQTLQEIGDRYGISRERVRQIEQRLKKKLKAFLLAELKDLGDVLTE